MDVGGLRAELVASVDYVNLRAAVGEQQRVLERGVASAGDGHGPALVEGPVADRAVADAVSSELLLARDSEPAVLSAGGEDDGLCCIVAVGRDDGVTGPLAPEPGDLSEFGLRAHVQRLGEHPVRQLCAGDGGYAGEIVHHGRPGYLPAEAVFFQYEHGLLSPTPINRRREPCGTASDDDDVISTKHSNRSHKSCLSFIRISPNLL